MFRILGAVGVFIFFNVVMAWHDAYGADCNRHPVYCHIVRIAPHTPRAMEISNTIVRAGKRHGVDPHLIVAIAMQESGLRAVHRASLAVDADGCRLLITDFGIMQVNEHSIPAYGLDAERLYSDVAYQIDAGTRILADKLRTFGHWSAYHSMTPKYNQRYRNAVGRYLQ